MKALEEARVLFLESEPYATRRVIEDDGREHIFFWEKFTDTPDSFGLIAGDAIHNLRSSLDHLAVALARAGADAIGVALTPEELARIQFPVVTSEDNFLLQSKRLFHTDPGAVAYIKSVQPYIRSPNNPKISLLYLVSDLDNADKHRLITTAALVPIMTKLDWPASVKNTQAEYPTANISYEVGAEFCRFRFTSPQSEMDVPVEFAWGVALWLGVRWSNADVMNVLRDYIADIRYIVWILSLRFIPPLGVTPSQTT